jgi:hypothetical protein
MPDPPHRVKPGDFPPLYYIVLSHLVQKLQNGNFVTPQRRRSALAPARVHQCRR